jgi:hypothetical protein
MYAGAMSALRQAISRFFWSEERREREAPRRREKEIWIHPALWWIVFIATLAEIGLELIPERHVLVRMLLRLPYMIVIVVFATNAFVVWRRRRNGWAPIDGVHTSPTLAPGQSPLAVRWRWLTRQHDPGSD